jgi:peptidoglycan/xylan/chitin deacetylase (PgdA/CDA1 family)
MPGLCLQRCKATVKNSTRIIRIRLMLSSANRVPIFKLLPVVALSAFFPMAGSGQTPAKEPIPDKLVVLTFDDSVKSHFSVVRPILKQYGFGATFFITEGFDFKTNKEHYMTWEEIAHLHQDGFEIGNHTRDHMSVKKDNVEQLAGQIQAVNDRCREHGIPATTSFAYPGNSLDVGALPVLAELGIRFARRGGAPEFPYKEGKGFAYEPGLDHPLLIPSAGDARPDWTLDDFRRAVQQAQFGRIAVLQFHGVPDLAHPWVHSPVERFKEYMQYLADNHYTVVALRDLEKYVDPEVKPSDPFGAINDRKRALAAGKSRDDFRPPKSDSGLRYWLENMVWHHNYTVPEIRSATGLSTDEIATALKHFKIRPETKPKRPADAPLLVMPYPGGRHPRTGFLDGAIRPQRETKFSLFLPWDERSYVVVDVPEAIRRNDEKTHGLLYLAHTHVDTMWTRRGIDLEKLEWTRGDDGTLTCERRLPNNVVFGTKVFPARDAVRMEMWLTNGSREMLTSLTVQNCVMLKDAPEFAERDNDNKVISEPYIACRSTSGNRWLIAAWEPCKKAWGNPPCPCMHSDTRFPDCAPGETKRLHGWLSFYKGTDIESEFRRLDALGWRSK